MIDILTVGQRKPLAKITFINGWQVVMQMTSPVSDNGNVESFATNLTAYAPDGKGIPDESRHALSPDDLVKFLAHVQKMA